MTISFNNTETFRDWVKENLGDYLGDIAAHGADAGYPYITYTADTVQLYDRFEQDIYDALNEDAEEFGYDNPEALIATFNRSDMLEWPEGRKNLLVWYFVERVANEAVNV